MLASAARWLVAPAVLAAAAACAPAGWVSVRNDTGKAVLIQDAPDGKGRRGRCVRLLPNEVYREFHALSGSRTVDVFDAADLVKPVHRAVVRWPATGTFVRLTREPDPKTKVDVWSTALGLPASPAAPGAPPTPATPAPAKPAAPMSLPAIPVAPAKPIAPVVPPKL